MASLITPCHSAPRTVWSWLQRIVRFLRSEGEPRVHLDMGAGIVVTVTLSHEAAIADCSEILKSRLGESTLRPARDERVMKSRAAFVLEPPMGGQVPARN